jgi:protein gp37
VKIPGEQMLLLDWIICGGESGPHARPMHPDWARSLRESVRADKHGVLLQAVGQMDPL